MHLWIQHMMTEVCSAGFPHSEIAGSKDICSSPTLIAAYHVFHRLSVPRHPPCALCSMTTSLYSVTTMGRSFFIRKKCVVKFKSYGLMSYHFQYVVFKVHVYNSDLLHASLPEPSKAFSFLGHGILHMHPRLRSVKNTFFRPGASSARSGNLRGDNEIRTRDLLLARQALSQLSYTPKVGLSGLEPPTSRLSGVRSNRLSYKPINLASTYSPVPSPAKYHRPSAS